MRFEWQGDSGTGGSMIVAHAERYDAVPFVNQLIIDGRPRIINGDRLAVAAALAFRADTSGSLELPMPVSPATAQALQEFLHPAWIIVAPIDFTPRALPIGTTRLKLSGGPPADDIDTNRFGEQRRINFDLRRSDQYAGQLMSLDHHVVCSNSWMFGEPGSQRALNAALAVAVLFAESLQADEIEFPKYGARCRTETEKASKLLQASRLALIPNSPPL